MHSTAVLLAMTAVALMFVPGPVRAQNAAGASPFLSEEQFLSENDEVIVAVSLRDDVILSDGMIGYLIENDILLPFEQMMFLLEFPIQIAADGRTASGWFLDPTRLFTLDSAAGQVTSEGRPLSFDPDALRVVEGELYVPARLLSAWFPLDFIVNLRALSVSVEPREALAIDDRIARSDRKFGVTYRFRSVLPELPTPYSPATIPAVSADLAVGYRSNRDVFGTYSIRASGDLLYNNGELFVIGDEDELLDARIRLGRYNPRGGLLGRLDATEYAIGDIASPALPLITGAVSGRGIRVQRRPVGFVGSFDTVDIEGPIELNYEVELYRNDILINAQNPESATYLFEDVELLNGPNEIRLEFYGPQGQRRTETRFYQVGGTRARKGQLLYDVALAQLGETVIGVDPFDEDYPDDGIAGSVRLDYGLTNNLSASAGVSYIPIEDTDETRVYGTAGLQTQLGRFAVNANTAVDDTGGIAASLGVGTRVDNVSLTARQEVYFNDFLSNRSLLDDDFDNDLEDDRDLVSFSSVDAVAAFPKALEWGYVSANTGADVAVFENGDVEYGFDAGATLSARRFSTGGDIFYRGGDTTERLDGRGRFNLRFSDYQLRGSLDYRAIPDAKLRNASLRLSRTFDEGYVAALGYSHDFDPDRQTAFASLTRDFGTFTAGIFGSHSTGDNFEDETSVFLTLSFSTFTDPKTLRPRFNSQRFGRRGAVRASVYVDENQNGRRDPGERPLPDVEVRTINGELQRTGADGETLIMTPTDAWIDVAIGSDSLNDPLLRPATVGYAVLPRPGVVSEVALPVIVTADVEGVVAMVRGEETVPLTNVEIQVVRADRPEEIVANALTAFDGYYFIDGVPTGTYLLRIEPGQAERLGIAGGAVRPLAIEADSDLLTDQDFTVTRGETNP